MRMYFYKGAFRESSRVADRQFLPETEYPFQGSNLFLHVFPWLNKDISTCVF